jgi:hypothetical protein
MAAAFAQRSALAKARTRCLFKKSSSSDRIAASSNTMERYKSEAAGIRQPSKTDVMPAAESKNMIKKQPDIPPCFLAHSKVEALILPLVP